VAWWAQEEAMAVTVIAPSRMERAPGLQVKTDRLEVGRMARQLENGSLKGIYIPERAGHERRQVVRTYGQAVKERKRAQVRLRSLLQEPGASARRRGPPGKRTARGSALTRLRRCDRCGCVSQRVSAASPAIRV
jgi:hypothetical protein